jgi:serine phosphatase RsbU (regulator of sigma subunit)
MQSQRKKPPSPVTAYTASGFHAEMTCAGGRTLSHTEEPQFPLGLLAVSSFDGKRLETAPGDLLVVATDWIPEVCNKPREEFGVESG